MNIDFEKYTNSRLPELRRVSSRGNSEESLDTYTNLKLNQRPNAKSVTRMGGRRRIRRTKALVDPKDREMFALPESLAIRKKSYSRKSGASRLNLTSDNVNFPMIKFYRLAYLNTVIRLSNIRKRSI